jgi:hypothetical protein
MARVNEKSLLDLTPEQKKEVLPFVVEILNEVLGPKHLPPDWTEAKEGIFVRWLKDGTLRAMVNDLANVKQPPEKRWTVEELDRLVAENRKNSGEGA